MSSDEEDFLNYTPLQRSQVSSRESKPRPKPSRLSLSFRKSQTTDKKPKLSITPTKSFSSKGSRATKKNTPIKSRADEPEKDCSDFQLAKWKFLFGSEVKKDEKPQPLRRSSAQDGESSSNTIPTSQQKRKSTSEDCVPESTKKKQDPGICSICKFPFNSVHEKSLHSFLCESKEFSNLPRCPKGIKCWETEEQHFWKFDHRERSIDTSVEPPCTTVKTNPLKDLVEKTDPNNSSTNDSGYNGIAGPSTSRKPFMDSMVPESPEIVVLSDVEESDHCVNYDSMPLFDLKECEHQEGHTVKELLNSENSHESSNLLDSPIIPDLELNDNGDDSTLYFDEENISVHSSLKGQEGQENQKSPVNHTQGSDDPGSETPELREHKTQAEDEEGELELDPEGDELIASLAEGAVDHIAMPVLEKIMKWRKDCKEAHTSTPDTHSNSQSRDLRISDKTVAPPLCFHFHYHEANPSLSPSKESKESGQTSILTYFKPTKSKEESCPCGEKKTVPKQENVAVWQGLMNRMQKKKTVSLPSVSQSSSEQWSDGTKQRWGNKPTAEAKTCPFYKYIPDTSFVVDAFNYGSVDGVTAYFLSHFHYDHYCGLRKNFSHPIYCSEITARLVNKRLGVSLTYLNPLPMWKPLQVCGVEVTLLDANHCPGAVMFLFKVKPGVTHLHVGDFRGHPSMERYPALRCPINTLFLDTTYCSPEHVFPTQESMIKKCVSLAQDHYQRNNKTLFVIGSYTIGKEKVFKAIALSLNCSIWVRDYKKQVLNCIKDEDIQTRLTNSRTSAKVHVLPMSEVKGEKLKDYLNQLRASFSEIVGMCPTGWEFTGASSHEEVDGITSQHPFPDVYIYGIPYSEHSSFSELGQFVQFIKPKKIIPTVNNGSQASRKRMQQHFTKWLNTRQLFP